MKLVLLIGVVSVGLFYSPKTGATIGIGLIVSVLGALFLIQDKLLYVPDIGTGKDPRFNPPPFQSPDNFGLKYEDVFVPVAEPGGTTVLVHTWFFPALSDPQSQPTMIFCHENAGNMGLRLPQFKKILRTFNVNLVTFDYRGYGRSQGEPSEPGLIRDTNAVLDWVLTEKASVIDSNKVFLYGSSLGGAVALHTALERENELRGLIIVNTFTSIPDLVDTMMPWIAFNFIKTHFLRLKWANKHVAPKLSLPILYLSSQKDEIVPASHMEELKRITVKSCDCQMIRFPDSTHNDIVDTGGQLFWESQADFLERCMHQ